MNNTRNIRITHGCFLYHIALIIALGGFFTACAVVDSDESVVRDSAAPRLIDYGTGEAQFRLIADQPFDVMDAALALQQVFRDVARTSVPTVVKIDTTQTRQRFGTSFE